MWRKSVAKNLQVKFDHPKEVAAPIKKGQKLGQLTLVDEDGFKQTVDLVAVQDVEQTVASHLVARVENNPSFLLIGGCLGLGAYYMRAKSRRRMKPYAKPGSRSPIN
jgi:hypothetical protein